MGDIYTTITDAAVLDADEVTKFNNVVFLAAQPQLVAEQAVTVFESGPAKIFQFAKYASLSKITSGITDGEEVASVALADSVVYITPVDYGNAISLLKKATLDSGNKASIAAAQTIGFNAGDSLDGLAITALDAFGGTQIWPNAATSTATVGAEDIMDKVFAGRLFNKLNRANIPSIGGFYLGIAHDDVLHDLRMDASNGGWTDVGRYADPNSVLRGEVGMFGGIRWLRSGNATVTTDGGAGSVDTYNTNVVGFNALGKGESDPLRLVISGPFDKLLRVVHFGWSWVGEYDTIDSANQVLGTCASSVGNNS
jgi:N4-gp56 family major capsid protein